jgi:hypothetical protein
LAAKERGACNTDRHQKILMTNMSWSRIGISLNVFKFEIYLFDINHQHLTLIAINWKLNFFTVLKQFFWDILQTKNNSEGPLTGATPLSITRHPA